MFCTLCKGEMKKGRVNFPVDVEDNFILIKEVPALVCEQCGEYFLEDDVAGAIEEIVKKAKAADVEFEIRKFTARVNTPKIHPISRRGRRVLRDRFLDISG